MGSIRCYTALTIVLCGCTKPASNQTAIATTNPAAMPVPTQRRAVFIQIPSTHAAKQYFQRGREVADYIRGRWPWNALPAINSNEFILVEQIDSPDYRTDWVLLSRITDDKCQLSMKARTGKEIIETQFDIEFLNGLIASLDGIEEPREKLKTDWYLEVGHHSYATYLTWKSSNGSGVVMVAPTYMHALAPTTDGRQLRVQEKFQVNDPEYYHILSVAEQVCVEIGKSRNKVWFPR